ncbi:hypothetical protein DPMN_009362 [Dreissena polymorpha]|uniref:Uncharacterized protein n=1 Tax=Dreissena polymorpha TaxID=45954 RepID=A0A9D4N122_DREPO|nr:hypothetical protein DPMN_009362 [Dreissena polymorpha]
MSPSYYRIVAIVLSNCRHRIVALLSSYYRIVAIVLSLCRHLIVALSSSYYRIVAIVLSRYRTVVIVLSHCRQRTIALSPNRIVALSSSYYRIVAIVLSHCRIVALWILMCYHDGTNGIPYMHHGTLQCQFNRILPSLLRQGAVCMADICRHVHNLIVFMNGMKERIGKFRLHSYLLMFIC